MALQDLQHYLIRARNIELTKKFYIEILGMKEGYRPAFSFVGYWLYLNDKPVVHLVEAFTTNSAQKNYLSHEGDISNGRNAIDHIAFHAEGYDEMVAHLKKNHIFMQNRIVPEENHGRQIFITDPNGIRIELNFSG